MIEISDQLVCRTYLDKTRLDFIPNVDQLNAVISFNDIRRERTGHHALVTIVINDNIKASDIYNIGRLGDREKLIRSAQKNMSELEATVWATVADDLMEASIWTIRKWDALWIEIEQAGERPPPPYFYMYPYIRRGAGTVLFASPNSGKSWLLQTMGITSATGYQGLWESQRATHVIYINLERDKESVYTRHHDICNALNISPSVNVHYIHEKGIPLSSVAPAVHAKLRQFPDAVVMFDSISRSSLGSLIEDQTANKIIDTLNTFGTWVAIGHTSRAESDHVFGSQHFDAGMDVGVKIASQRNANRLGIALTVTKANDLPPVESKILSFEFAEDGSGLQAISTGSKMDFQELLADNNISNALLLRRYVESFGETGATTTQAYDDTSIPKTFISRQFTDPTGPYVSASTRGPGSTKYYKIRE